MALADNAPVTDLEAVELAKQMSDAVKMQDAASAEKLLDTDDLLKQAVAGTSASPQFEAGFK